jgi:hypothetical protein
MARTKKPSSIALIVGGSLLLIALLWWLVAIPMLVKYPTDVDVRPHYRGTFTVYVDPTTAAPLAQPMKLPMTIDRHIWAVGDKSGADTVLVRETIVQKAGTLVKTTQNNAYVMDRTSLKNLKDPRAYAFTPTNVVDRSGTYRLNLPFGADANGNYKIYKNETGAPYTMQQNTTDPSTDREGLHLNNYVGKGTAVPLSDAYVGFLDQSIPLPDSLTLDQLKPHLLAAGVDVDKTLAALMPHLSQEDLASLGAIAGEPINLKYVLSFDGKASVEPATGADVAVGSTEVVGALPEMTNVAQLQEILARYPDVPEAVAAGKGLAAVAATPLRLFGYTYDQTPASVADIADEVASQRQMVLLAQRWIPLGLVAAAVVALIVAAVEWPRRKREARHVATPHPTHA